VPADRDAGARGDKPRFGVLGWLVLVSLALVGAWVVLGNVWDWARPWWRYATVASVSFTLGTFYGRFRRWEKQEQRRSA
jgi:hypothetical protein